MVHKVADDFFNDIDFTSIVSTVKGIMTSDGAMSILLDFERVIDIGQLAGRKFHVHDRSDDLNNLTCTHEFTPFARVLSSARSVLKETIRL